MSTNFEFIDIKRIEPEPSLSMQEKLNLEKYINHIILNQ